MWPLLPENDKAKMFINFAYRIKNLFLQALTKFKPLTPTVVVK